MRIPFASLFLTSPFEGLSEHAEKVAECGWAFQKAIECYITNECDTFELFRQEVIQYEHEADAIKRRIRGHLPKGALLPVSKFILFRYIREQDNVLDSVTETLNWISYRPEPAMPKELVKDFKELIEKVIQPIEMMGKMVAEAQKYFETFSEKQRAKVKNMIADMRQMEHESDQLEAQLMQLIFALDLDPVTVFHMVRLVEQTGNIADHAENAGDMMRAMLAK